MSKSPVVSNVLPGTYSFTHLLTYYYRRRSVTKL